MDHTLPVSACPPPLRPRHLTTEVVVHHPREDVWAWVCDPATFTDSQVWPWRVEFLDPVSGRPAGFTPGVLTTHHGPLMNFSGVIGEVRAPSYRDLAYTYGAWMISPRICRPVRLQIHLRDLGSTTGVTVEVDAQIRRGLGHLSDAVQRVFWRRFATWADRAIAAA